MLLSYRKLVRVSSEQRKHPACCAVDESIRSWWSAETGDTGEFLSLDLGEVCEVRAIQINFADEDAQLSGSVSDTYQYHLETSTDGKKWKPVGEKSLRITDTPHDYVVWRNLWQAAICVSQTCTYLPGSFLFRGFVFLVKRISLHQVWWTHGMDCVI